MRANPDVPVQGTTVAPASERAARPFLVVQASGDIDLASVWELDEALHAAMRDAPPPSDLVLDLAAVTFMDSSGLHTLAAAKRTWGEHFWLANPPRRVLRLFDAAGVTGEFPIVDWLMPTESITPI